MLLFDVDEMDERVPALVSMGASLDGPVKYLAFGKAASLRTPDGHMIALFQSSEPPQSRE